MDLHSFLTQVVGETSAAEAYLHVAFIPKDESTPYHHWFSYPKDVDNGKLLAEIDAKKVDHNVYFSPHLSSQKNDERGNALPTRTLTVDLDHADSDHLPLRPSVIVQTSEGRHQAYWFLKADVSLANAETFNRNLVFAIPDSDRSSWPLGYLVRMPTTTNFKYLGQAQAVKIVSSEMIRYDPADLELLPSPSADLLDIQTVEFINDPPLDRVAHMERHLEMFKDARDASGHKLSESAVKSRAGEAAEWVLMLRNKEAIPSTVAQRFNRAQKDKPNAQWEMMRGLFRAGVPREDVFWIAFHGANNQYTELHNEAVAARELAKDVLRAEAVAKTKSKEPREAVMAARKVGGFAPERKAHLFNLVLDLMKREGDFIRTSEDKTWYVHRGVGRPILLDRMSTYLNMLLDMRYGINSSEGDHMYVVSAMCSYGRSLPITAQQGALAWYDQYTKSVTVHTGKKDTIVITQKDIIKSVNGGYNVVFPWPPSVEPFSPIFEPAALGNTTAIHNDVVHMVQESWAQTLFGDGLANVVNLSSAEALAIMTVWFMFLMFRTSSITRPILALFGQPGSGKSTMFRRVYALLYGRMRSLNAVSTREDFDYAIATDPLVVLDNVDTWERWLPDQLALSSSTSDITSRKFYTQNEVVILKRQALVALTAHNPQFGRPDVADRLLIINLERFPYFRPEEAIIDRIHSLRNYLWGGICTDIQKVINTPFPKEGDVPQFRIEDFARYGLWISRGLDIEQAFVSALTRIQSSQRRFVLEDDNILVETLQEVLRFHHVEGLGDTGWISPGQLWDWLCDKAKDQLALKRVYRNAPNLSKRLIAMKEPLSDIFQMDWKHDASKGTRMWRIKTQPPKSEATPKELVLA